MTVFVLVREDQSAMGYIDSTVLGVFATREDAEHAQGADEASARREGLRNARDPRTDDGDWQVSWGIEQHRLA
jgi:hypothetical protein